MPCAPAPPISGASGAFPLCSLTPACLWPRGRICCSSQAVAEPWRSARVPSDCVCTHPSASGCSPPKGWRLELLSAELFRLPEFALSTHAESQKWLGVLTFPERPVERWWGTAGPAPSPCQGRTRPRRPLQDPARPSRNLAGSTLRVPPAPASLRPAPTRPAQRGPQPRAPRSAVYEDTARSQPLPFLPSRRPALFIYSW